MSFEIIRNDITCVSADAIVNTANPAVAVGAGVDSAIYEAAGREMLFAEREKIGPMRPGEAAATPAFALDAKYIIHTIGPVWRGGGHGERETVARCYRKSLELAAQLGCESIAFPLIATGTYGFPKDDALRIAVREISSFILDHEMNVIMVVYDKESFDVSGRLFSGIEAYIEESDVVRAPGFDDDGRTGRVWRRLRMRDAKRESGAEPRKAEQHIQSSMSFDSSLPFEREDDTYEEPMAVPSFSYKGRPKNKDKTLEDMLKNLDKNFRDYLFTLIDGRGMTDPQVYKKANLDRKLFSKIRSNPDYLPSRRTAIALAIALELNLDDTKDLLQRAGYSLSSSTVFDCIIEYCIINGEYDINEINCILFKFDQPLLGAA